MNTPTRILVIDDEPPFRMNLQALLEDAGHQVVAAGSGPEGLEVCARERPDLVLLDVRMPGMDGFEVCARLKADPELQEIPVIFLSGLMETREKVQAFQRGGVDFITKPFHIEEVEARLNTHLELRRQRAELEARNQRLSLSLRETELLNRKLVDINERLRRSEELKGHFLSMMRNGINNPLNAILAFGEEIEGGKVPKERERLAGELIAMEASGLDFQLRNIFCAAELEAGEAVPCINIVDADSVALDAIDSLRYQARAKSVRVRFQPGSPGCGRTWADAEKLRLIIANLLSNAIKFGPEDGQVDLRLDLEGEHLVVRVLDQGAGIREEDRQAIFERFRQLEDPATRLHMGQGLGLAVVKSLVDLLGGRVELEAPPGGGTAISCFLPCQEGSDPSEARDGNLFLFPGAEEV